MFVLHCLQDIDTSKYENGSAGSPKSGTFLASLASLSTLTVTSHHYTHRSHATLILHHSKPAARLVPAPLHHSLTHRSHGTKVTVRNLFSALPVRVKHRTLSRELPSVRQKDWHVLRHAVTGVLLAWNAPVSLTIRTSDDVQKAYFGKGFQIKGNSTRYSKVPDQNSFNLDFLCGILVQGEQCEADSWETWSKVSARTPEMTIRAIVSNQPAPSKNCQFISLGNRWMNNDSGFNVLYDEINKVFASSSFGTDEELTIEEMEQLHARKKLRVENGGYTLKELKGRGKGIDRWPMFYIRIEPRRSTRISQLRSDDDSPEGGKALQSVIEILGSMMTRFLSEHHYRVHARRNRNKESGFQHSKPDSRVMPNTKMDLKDTPFDQKASLTTQEPTLQNTDRQEESASSDVGKKRSRIKQKDNELESTVIFPKPPSSRGLGSHGIVGVWSRIKAARPIDASLRPETPAELTKAPATNLGSEKDIDELDLSAEEPALSKSPTLKIATFLESKPNNTELIYQAGRSCDNQEAPNGLCLDNVGLSPQAEPFADTNEGGDNPLSWMNPVTKSRVMINSRTGLLMIDNPRPVNRAASTHSIPAEPSKSLATKRRLLRASTEPSGVPATGTWAHGFLGSWDNPVFGRNEENIKQVSLSILGDDCGQILSGRHNSCTLHDIEKAFTESSAAFSARISSRSLGDAIVLGQLDNKFILIRTATTSTTKVANDAGITPESRILVLVDQHAADERYGVEALLEGLCSRPTSQSRGLQTSIGLKSEIETVKLPKPITISVTTREEELLKLYAMHFAHWGILLEMVPQHQSTRGSQRAPIAPKVQVLSLPPSIAERCRSDVKHLTELLRDEVWRLEELGPQAIATQNPLDKGTEPEHWLRRIRTCPPGILNMLNSRSCRSAIMFNDKLTLEECEMLIRRLAQCHFPFQCAHGRPTMIPLVDIGVADNESHENAGVSVGRSLFASDRSEASEIGFVDAWKRWKARKTEMEVEEE